MFRKRANVRALLNFNRGYFNRFCAIIVTLQLTLLCFVQIVSGIGVGDRIQAGASGANIRTAPSTTASITATATAGDLGVIISGPYPGSGLTWYSNHWDTPFQSPGYSATSAFQAIAPAAPTLVSPGNANNSGPIVVNSPITMKWNAVLGATNYGLYIRDLNLSASGPLVYSNDYIGSITSLSLQGFTPGDSFRWNMEASDSPGFSVASTLFYFQYIPAPTNIVTYTASSVTSTSAVFFCSFYPGGTPGNVYFQYGTSTSYGIHFDEASFALNLSGQQFFGTTNDILSPDTTYHYQAVVINNGGTYYGNDSSFTTPSGSPAAPSNLTASSGIDGIVLKWQNNSFNANGFYIQRRQNSTYAYFSIGAYQTNYTDTTALQSDQYCYTVSATNSAGSSAQTPEACATYLAPGPSPSAIIAGNLTPVTGTSKYVGSYSTGTIPLNYSWSTSAGQTSTSANPQFQFNSPGYYTIVLTVTDSAHLTSTTSIQINVQASNSGTTTFVVAIGADPVVLSTGNYIQNRVDLQMAGKGLPFEFRRFYNSKFSDQTGLPLGFGWTFSYNERLLETGTNVLVVQGDGSTWTFFPTNNGYVGEPGIFDSLAYNNSNNTWALTNKNQTVTLFDSNGRLLSITDKNANALTCSYIGGSLWQIVDTAGRTNIFSTNALGCISAITDQIGRVVQYQYDAQTNLIAVIDANNETNRYFYDGNHQMTNACDPKGVFYIYNQYDQTNFCVVSQHDALTNWTYFAYDFSNRITYVTNAFGKVSTYRFDTNLLETNVLDEGGNQAVFAYDANRNRIFVQDKNGNQTQYSYDALGNVTNKADALANVTAIQYNVLNNPIRRVDALTNVTTFGYDSRGNLTSTTNALGFVNSVQYNASGLPIINTDASGFSTTNQYDSQGNPTNVIDAHGFATQFVYDGVGRKIRQIDALNHGTSFTYDNDDNLLFLTNALNFVNAFLYDANNNRTTYQNPRNAIITSVFDSKNRLVAVLAPLNQTNGTLYDALDRKIATFDAFGNQTGYTYDAVGDLIADTNALNQVTQFTYDAQGNQTSVVDPTGHYVTNYFDALNRKIVSVNVSISTNLTAYDALGRVGATISADGQTTQFFYDGIGRITNVVDAAGKSSFFTYDQNGNRLRISDSNGHSWTNAFDELNRLVEQDDPLGRKTDFHYDSVGNLTNKITPNGDSINYSYDALTRLVNIVYPEGPTVTFAYDSVGNRTNMTDGAGITRCQFDLLDRLTSITDPYGQIVSNSYDPSGNRVGLTYPGGKVVNYGFDALNRMIALTNWLNGVVTYTYDSRGNLIVATNANATTTSYDYDVGNRLVALTNATSGGGVIAAYALTLDALGNHTQAVQSQPLFPILSNQTNNYVYDSDNRLLAIDGQTVTHNPNGDLTSIGTNSYSYDFEDRLLEFSLTNTFIYDGLGNRLGRTVNEQARRFVLDRVGALTQVLVESDTNNSPASCYVYGIGLTERISSDGAVFTYHFNDQGSTVALTDSAGTLADSFAYDSFGVLANSDEDFPQSFRYLGQYGIMDDGTGLLYARARYFSPQLGRFFTKDVATSRDNDSQTLNRFVYGLNNPLRFVDATGFVATEGNFTLGARLIPLLIIVPEQAEVLFPPKTANSTSAYIPGGSGIGWVQVANFTAIGVQIAGEASLLGPETLFASPEEFAAEDAGLTTAEGLTTAAGRAATTVGEGSGRVYGTQVHSAFETEVNAMGNDNLSTEVSYLNGQTVDRGTAGSVRLDVVEGPPDAPTAIYDLKTGSAQLTPGRIQQIQSHIPGGNGVPVYEIRP